MAVGSIEGSYIYRMIDRLFGVEKVRQPRENFKKIIIEKHEVFQRWGESTGTLKQEAAKARNRARECKWDTVAFWLSIAGVALYFLPYIPTVASIVSVIVSVLTGLRRVAVEILLYEESYRMRTRTNLKFACAWNRAMNGWTSLAVVPLGMISVLMPQAYRIGLWIIAEEVENECN